MTREEAIKGLTSFLEVRRKYGDMQTMKDEMQCFEIAIEALKQESCEDAISRQAVLDLIDADWKYEGLEVPVANLPPVIPQPQSQTGYWNVNKGIIYCSACGCGALYDKVYPGESVFGKTMRVKSTFCPTCGAKMIKSQERSRND